MTGISPVIDTGPIWRCLTCGFKRPEGFLAPTERPYVRRGPCRWCKRTTRFVPLLDEPDGTTLKTDGMTTALSHADEGVDAAWKIEARRVALRLASSGLNFTINDITDEVGLPISRNVTGAFLNGLAREGLIRRIGYAAGERASQHARTVAVWVKA